MIKKHLFFTLMVLSILVDAQVISTNRNPVSLEHNTLFNATTRYTVTHTGSGVRNMDQLFDGKFNPSYSADSLEAGNPCIILIEGLKKLHTQNGAWVGWSTRAWPATQFKIEGYNQHANTNIWVTFTDISNFTGRDFLIKVPAGTYTKLRFTFYSSEGTNGRHGISELLYIHPEAVYPYEGLFTTPSDVSAIWNQNGSDISYSLGNVGINETNPIETLHINGAAFINNSIGGLKLDNVIAQKENNYIRSSILSSRNGNLEWNIDEKVWTLGSAGSNDFAGIIHSFSGELGFFTGSPRSFDTLSNEAFRDQFQRLTIDNLGRVGIETDNPDAKLTVKGDIHTNEVTVDLLGAVAPDFVFEVNYHLSTLEETEVFIKENKHLPNIPSASEMEKNGINLKEMNLKLLEKIEELTLHLIEQKKRIDLLEVQLNSKK